MGRYKDKYTSEELEDWIISLRKENLTYNEITKKIGCSKSSVSKYCHKHKLLWDYGNKQQEISDDKIEKIKTITKSMTVDEAVKNLGIKRTAVKKYKGKRSNHKVYQYDFDGKLIKEWRDLNEVDSHIDYKKSTVKNVCNPNNKNKTAYGFIWKYVKD